ncbi:MAG: PEP-utilizing enzyme [Patescibacteria group bacterium]|jgi:phosphohistidine swiveling domain-containing protein
MNFKSTKKKILINTKRWVIQGGVGVPLMFIIPAEAITKIMHRRFPILQAKKIIIASFNGGNRAYWIFDEDELTKLGEWCLGHVDFVNKIYFQWEKDKRRYYKNLDHLAHRGIKNLQRDFLNFYNLYLYEYSLPLITEYFSLAGDKLIKNLKSKYGFLSKIDEDIILFASPPKLAFLQMAELGLLDLYLKLKGRLPKTLEIFKKKQPAAYQKLIKIQKEYYWMHFNYRDTKPLSLGKFYSQLRMLDSENYQKINNRHIYLKNYEKDLRRRQHQAEQKTKLSKEEIKKLKRIGFAAHWQDERKVANLLGNYWCNRFISQVTKISNLSVSEAQHLIPQEFIASIKGKKIVRADLKKRISGMLYYVFADGQEGILTGRQLAAIWKIINEMNLKSGVNELKGIAASPGYYRGRVRKIETPGLQGKKLKKGEVLMTYMTRPDFVPLIRRAGAIVTDEGGLTSHAAIISRELEIPCVVGTRFAMRLFKNGEMVEVDANKGIIKRL